MANLGKLIKQADAAAESASRLVLRAMREIRGELALLADELNLTGSAADRDKAYQMIQKKMARLSRRLDALMDAQNHLAGKTAAKSAEEMTGLEVKYSAARANAIIELVTPAQGENLAAVFTENMAANSIRALQEATVAVMREQAVAGGTMKEMKKALGERWQKAISAPPVFTDAGGHTWDTGAYLQMNIRTNTMRVYNDCLVDDVARTTGSDLVRVSTGGDPMCRFCAPWEGVILSVSGKTKGFPTYEQARQAGCFHPNCVHTIETVDDVWDGDEIELQKAHPVTKETATDPDAMDERKYKMDQERYRRKGMNAEAARLAVDRDNLEANIRHGLIRSDARAIVDKLTDAQITALCKDGNPPRFTPTKKATKKNPHAADEKFIHGKRGGVVHIKRDAGVDDLVRVARLEETKEPAKAPVPPTPKPEPKPKPKPEPKTLNINTLVELSKKSITDPQAKDFDLRPEEMEIARNAIETLNSHVENQSLKCFTRIEFHRGVDWNASVRFGTIKFNIDALMNAKTRWDAVQREADKRADKKPEIIMGARENVIGTLIDHELGHWAQQGNNLFKKIGAEYKKAKRLAGKLPSLYAKTNEMEFFAECYAQYHADKDKLTESQRKMVEQVKAGLPEKLLRSSAQVIESSCASNGSKIYLPIISKETADEIKKVCGTFPKSRIPTVGGDEIRHTFNRHGKHVDGKTVGEKQKDQIPITAEDIARIAEIIDTPDKIEKGKLDNQTGLETAKISKMFSDGTNVSIFVLADNLQYKTMWKKKR